MTTNWQQRPGGPPPTQPNNQNNGKRFGVVVVLLVEIAGYICSLEVRILAEPTNGLNHGFNPDSGAPYEVKWGTDDDERGWVRSDNLARRCCPPEQIEWQCPGPNDVAAWADPDRTDQVGWHTGTLHPTADNTDIFGPVQPVGGPNPTIINDFYTALDDVGYDDRVICECVTDPGKGGANV